MRLNSLKVIVESDLFFVSKQQHTMKPRKYFGVATRHWDFSRKKQNFTFPKHALELFWLLVIQTTTINVRRLPTTTDKYLSPKIRLYFNAQEIDFPLSYRLTPILSFTSESEFFLFHSSSEIRC